VNSLSVLPSSPMNERRRPDAGNSVRFKSPLREQEEMENDLATQTKNCN